ncbi:MAG: Gfo/Idh/MocA family protein [Candidatus Methylomirabilales bacterium]
MKRLRVGVIGLGVGEEHIAAYGQHPACELVAVCDVSPEKRAAARQKYPAAAIMAEAKDILKHPEIDLVSIASYDDAHYEQTLLALQSGKHIFVEKPLCRSVEELRSIKRCWLGGDGLCLASNLVLRAAPLYGWLGTQIEKGAFGQVYAFDGEYLYGRIEKITEGWRKDVEGYSVIQGGGIHLVDLMLRFLAERPVTVTAAGNKICTAETDFQYLDYVVASYVFPSGAIGRISANFGCVHRHQHIVRVFGTNGTFFHDDAGARMHASRDPSRAPVPLNLSPVPATKGALIPDFVDGILNRRDTRAKTQQEFDVISACVAADQAVAAGTGVEIEYA